MPATTPSGSIPNPRTHLGGVSALPPAGRPRLWRGRGSPGEKRALACYPDGRGRPREVVALAGHAHSVLVVDRDAETRGDRRLVAHLGADEPASNAALVCRAYLDEARGRGPCCRPMTQADARAEPFPRDDQALRPPSPDVVRELLDRSGCGYRLEPVECGMSIPEMRWRRHPRRAGEEPIVVSVRRVIGHLERYEPVRALTRTALASSGDYRAASTAVLRVELARLLESPIVLNRRLREVLLETVAREDLSMSEIAMRCGRVKRDGSGGQSGETSWLGRRLGLLPEGGKDTPTPWIHSDVLALIARAGLGVAPHEVELE
jgi:hypothetical protein